MRKEGIFMSDESQEQGKSSSDEQNDFAQYLKKIGVSENAAEETAAGIQHFTELESFILEEIKERSADHPELQEIRTIHEFLDYYDRAGQKAWKEIYDAAEKRFQKGRKPVQINSKPIKQEIRPMDKANATVWNDLTRLLDEEGRIYLKAEKAGSKTEKSILYSINFDGLDKDGITLSKELTAFDKDVYSTIASIMHYGNTDVISVGQIASIVYNKKTPGTRDLQTVNDSITKMAATWIMLDNSLESGYKYPHFKYDGHLLPCERVSAYINNNLTKAAIHVFRFPPLISFAQDRAQITTVSTKLLYGAPINKTEQNRRLADYLITRIAHIEKSHGRTSPKMLYATIFEHCGIVAKKQKERAPETINRFLDFYKDQGFIRGYRKLPNGVEILC